MSARRLVVAFGAILLAGLMLTFTSGADARPCRWWWCRPPTPGPTVKPTPTPTLLPPPTPGAFVTRSGTTLMLNGQAWNPVGLNFPVGVDNPAIGWTDRFGDAMRDIAGLDLARVWTVQANAVINGARDWQYIDQMLSRAEAYNRKVVMVLTDQWQSPGHQPIHDATADRNPTWFQTGYKSTVDAFNTVTYKAWVQEIVARYKGRTSIAFWQLINEGSAETPACANETTSRNTLRAFADDMAATIKATDPNHLVSLGTIEGQCGSNGPDYAYIHSGPNIDIADYHDYTGTSTGIPGESYNGLGTNITRIHDAGKVILVAESGIDWRNLPNGRQSRADAFQFKITAQRNAGTSGFLMWTWGGYTFSNYDFEIPYGDPALAILPSN